MKRLHHGTCVKNLYQSLLKKSCQASIKPSLILTLSYNLTDLIAQNYRFVEIEKVKNETKLINYNYQPRAILTTTSHVVINTITLNNERLLSVNYNIKECRHVPEWFITVIGDFLHYISFYWFCTTN